MSNNANNKNLALSLAAIIVGMTLLTFASVPLYSLFCKLTGYGGTTQEAQKISYTKGTRKIKVNFDANVSPELNWFFIAKQKSVTVTTGENTLIFYTAANLENKPIIGTAIYNVTPYKAAVYFNKIQCFCFNEQLLKAKENSNLPVSFFIDPEFDKDPELKDLNEITLSYTFFKTAG
ncbi:MAG: cytochrome c oxidase assembly protein [Rickettsiales bacterium]|nr:cytochrome c oxidase assembly protein [Rickettsiales bacterium]